MFLLLTSAVVDWLELLGNDEMIELSKLKWRTFTVEFNPNQVLTIKFVILIHTFCGIISFMSCFEIMLPLYFSANPTSSNAPG